jgi:hypothetical protein
MRVAKESQIFSNKFITLSDKKRRKKKRRIPGMIM